MKTGRPEYRIPEPQTVSRDVRDVFKRVRQRIAKMLEVCLLTVISCLVFLTFIQDHDGDLNFATDAWTSPNSRAFVALTVHFEHEGVPVSMLLDIVEVSKSHTGRNLAVAFAQILNDFNISDKVR